ncbi:hypothetical protein FACS189426_06520 [Bacteroidia bacterium]|nr:hypothetical protein FACS189426_06520 [Bacteroidia bacterium]GHV71891.1 hypothetical protein FACS189420_8300 [Bacteroidia bacterium]
MKRIEEIANDYVVDNFPNESEHDYHQELCVKSYIQGYKDANKWISVDDELPKNYITVIARKKMNLPLVSDIICLCYIYNSDWFFLNNNACANEIKFTDWRPVELK